jgi:hypothetical protein
MHWRDRRSTFLLALVAGGALACASPRSGTPIDPSPAPPDAADGPPSAPAPQVDAASGPEVGSPAPPSARCGNGVVDVGELCDGNCPTSCPRGGCSPLTLLGKASTCDAVCVELGSVSACMPGDGCCPPACNAGNDGDCSQQCGPADGVCPGGCNPGQDADCKRSGGAACQASGECASGYCIDGACCTQGCGACQSCTGAGGTCVQIAQGRTDDFPANACSGDFACDGTGNCRARCDRPGDLMCTNPAGATGCGRFEWGFEEPALPEGASLAVDDPGLAATPLLVTTTRANSGERSVTTTVPRDAVLGVGVSPCVGSLTQTSLANRNATAYYYLDRSGPVGPLAYVRIKAWGYDSAGSPGEVENRTLAPPVGRWTKTSVNFQVYGTRAGRIELELYTGTEPDAETHLYVDDVRVE